MSSWVLLILENISSWESGNWSTVNITCHWIHLEIDFYDKEDILVFCSLFQSASLEELID